MPNENFKILNGILYEILENNAFLNEALDLMEIKYAYLASKDRHFIRRTVKGVIERKLELDFYINSISNTPVKKQKKWVRTILRSAFYQIKYMNIKDYAVVDESVKLIKKLKYKQFSGFVNGVLRNYIRKKDELIPRNLEEKYSIPNWIIEKFIKEEGMENTTKILSSFSKIRPIMIRLNTKYFEKDLILSDLKEEGYTIKEVDPDYNVYSLSGIDSLNASKTFSDGKFYIQDLSAMYPIFLANLKKGYKVLDTCASPGGKTLLMAEIVGDTGKILSCDISEKKTDKIKENIKKSGFLNINVMIQDATKPNPDLREKFDAILADVPCSGLGVIGRKADIRYRLKKEDIKSLSFLQKEIIDNTISYLKKDGIFIYSTCTISKEENEDNRDYILNKYKDLYLFKEKKILPFMYESDGFYTAIFKKQE